MSPKARQALAIVAVAALVVGVLAGTSVALWQDLSPEERAVLVPILNPRLGLLIMIGLVLIGPPGLGKTLALAAIINEACKVYRGPVYATWPDALASLKAGIGGAKGDPRCEAVDSLRDAPFLALDEVAGVRDASDFDHSELLGLIDYRYREELPTLVAANATAAQFPGLVGERVADRLRETGPQLVLIGESQRGKAALDGAAAFEEPPRSIKVRTHNQGAWRERTITFRDGRIAA